MQWRLSAAARNHKGILRPNNEDNFYLNGCWLSEEAMARSATMARDSVAAFQLYAVCDGMGGEARGEQASLSAARAMATWQTSHLSGVTDQEIMTAIRALTNDVHALGQACGQSIGTTLTALLWQNGRVQVLNVGDSRAYRLRDKRFTQLTVDHSAVQKLVQMGMLTPEQARLSPQRHFISQYVGMASRERDFQPDLSPPIAARAGDRYLLCSDGLYEMVARAAIRHTMRSARTPAEAADRLVQLALDNGGRDNVTVVCLWVYRGWGSRVKDWLMRLRERSRGEHRAS